jgi:hypothetical protein
MAIKFYTKKTKLKVKSYKNRKILATVWEGKIFTSNHVWFAQVHIQQHILFVAALFQYNQWYNFPGSK